jgi:FkbM family methyltransferase
MNMFYQKLRWSPNFIREFGFKNGIKLLFQNVKNWPHKTTERKRYKVSGYSTPIHLRSNIADHATFRQCMVMKQYDFLAFPQSTRLMETYRSMIDSGAQPLIMDCGANIGLATLWFAKHFPRARILAVEPDDENFRLLQINTQHLGDAVMCVQGGVWNKSASLKISNPDAGSASFQMKESDQADSAGMKAYTIEELCAMANSSDLLIVKLDIEGSQAALFESNTDWVKRSHLITLELDDWLLPWAGTSRNFFKCLSKYPFDYLIHKESIFCFQDIAPSTTSRRVP